MGLRDGAVQSPDAGELISLPFIIVLNSPVVIRCLKPPSLILILISHRDKAGQYEMQFPKLWFYLLREIKI